MGRPKPARTRNPSDDKQYRTNQREQGQRVANAIHNENSQPGGRSQAPKVIRLRARGSRGV